MAIEIFFCYAHEDEALRQELEKQLGLLKRQGIIDVWHDRDISAGAEWEHEIDQHLNSAQIILLLVSPDFMNSDYCYSKEMRQAMERYNQGKAIVIPVILRPVFWQSAPFGKLQALPKDARPVTDPQWHNLDRAFYSVAEGIIVAVAELRSRSGAYSSSMNRPIQSSPFRSSVIQKRTVPVASNNPSSYTLWHTLNGHLETVTSVTISQDEQWVITESSDKTIKIWDLFTGELLSTFIRGSDAIYNAIISPDKQFVIEGDKNNLIKVWHLQTRELLRTFTGHLLSVRFLCISPSQSYLVSGSLDRTIKVWSFTTGQLLHSLKGHSGTVCALAISSDEQYLVSGSEDKTIKVWNLITGQLLHTLIGHTGYVFSVAISPDGQNLASGSQDKTLKIWKLPSGQHKFTFDGYWGSILGVAIGADSKTLVCGSSDGSVDIWNLNTYKLISSLENNGRVYSVAISANAQLVASSNQRSVKIWRKNEQ